MTLQEQIAEIDVKINSLNQKMTPLQQKKSSLIRMKDKLKDELDKQNVEAIRKESKEKQAEYFINAVGGGMYTYDAFKKFLTEETALALDCTYRSGCRQFRLRIAMHQDKSNLESVYESILFFMPMLKPNDDSVIEFDIMEESLSYHQSYYLNYDLDDGYWAVTSGGRSKLHKNKDLKYVLSKICEELYYIPVGEEE